MNIFYSLIAFFFIITMVSAGVADTYVEEQVFSSENEIEPETCGEHCVEEQVFSAENEIEPETYDEPCEEEQVFSTENKIEPEPCVEEEQVFSADNEIDPEPEYMDYPSSLNSSGFKTISGVCLVLVVFLF
jgi:hypothetical protein